MNAPRWVSWLPLIIVSLGSPCWLAANEPTWNDLEHQFHELPMSARRHTGPLFWLHGAESPARLEQTLARVAEGGNGTFTAESRPHRDWLGEGWFRDLAVCLNAAKRHDLTMWIFDEKWWPSQEVGGHVPLRYGSKRLTAESFDVEGPQKVEKSIKRSANLIAVVAGKKTADGIDSQSLIDLSAHVSEGKLTAELSQGAWKLMIFTWEPAPGPRILVDGASKDCVDWFLKTVYQPHYDHFKDDFGKTIVGFFYDEPETHGDWGTEVPKVLAEKGVDWKQAYVSQKYKLAGDAQAAADYAYHEALGEAWGRTLYGGMSQWCREHGVLSFGHFLEHTHEYLAQDECAGNMIQLQKYSDMGAIDAVFKQFVPGKKDDSTYQSPKLGSSITHAYGKADDLSMVEIFGARGQDLTYPEMKWWTDLMQVAGVNFLIPHSFNPRAPYDADCPPYFYNGGFEPRWPLYRVFADYTSRLNLLLTGGLHACPVAFLFPGYSTHVGTAVPPEEMTTALQDALYDCDWIPYEVFEKDIQLSAQELQLRNERYRVLIVPTVEVIPLATLEKARQFFQQGGVVIGYGFLPSKSATLGRSSAEVRALTQEIWGEEKGPSLEVCKTSLAGGRSYFLPQKPTPEQLQRVLAQDAGVHSDLEVLDGETNDWLHVLHRLKSGRDVFLVCNQNIAGKAQRFRLRIKAQGVPECWDAMRNEISSIPFRRQGESVELTVLLEPLESILLVFQPQQRNLPPRSTPDIGQAKQTIPVNGGRRAGVVSSEPPTPPVADYARLLKGGSWVWYPEGNPAASAPPGARFFRKTVAIPEGRSIKQALFLISADNEFVLFVNGRKVGQSGGGAGDWTRPAEIDLTGTLHPGPAVLAITATNTASQPNPAGLIGLLRVEFDRGEPLVLTIDQSWKVHKSEQAGWKEASFDDSSWSSARVIAPLGGAPWGRMTGSGPTLSPVKADPFEGRVEIPSDLELAGARIVLDMDEIRPEAAARVTINGQDAGGFIGRPLRLDVTRLVKPGGNTIKIEPFTPRSVRLLVEGR